MFREKMSSKKRSASSRRWLQEHFNDKYVIEAQKKKLRSRAWFKLDEIDNTDKIFKRGMFVLDLGAAPGGWSQYVVNKVGLKGKVIALDLLPMDSILGVEFLQGDFREKSILKSLLNCIGDKKIDVVISDMAPNMTGISSVDIPKSMHLAELAFDISRDILIPGGSFLVKVFQGEGFEQYLREMRSLFKKVKVRKPDASRIRSREVYIVATGLK